MVMSAPVRILTLDHATVPSIDLLADFRFYQKFMGGDFQKKGPSMVNFSTARQKQGRAAIFFIEVCGVSGFGLFLQSEYPPKPARMLEGPRYGFAVVGKDLGFAASIFRKDEIDVLGPLPHESESPFRESVYLKDPSGNSIELAVWRDRSNVAPVGKQGLIPLAGMCHVAVDADIEVMHKTQGSKVDPMRREPGPTYNSRALFDACRPFDWIDEFPPVTESSPEFMAEIMRKWGHELAE